MLQLNSQSLIADMAQSPADVAAFQAQWADLLARAIQPAGLNHAAIAAALFKAKPFRAGLSLVRQGGQLLFALPTVKRNFPAPVLANWTTPLSFMGLPHLDRERPAETLETFLAAANCPVMLRSVPVGGPFWNSLRDGSGRFAVLEMWERAALNAEGDFDAWFAANFERKRRKEFRRLKARLSEQGRLTSETLRPGVAPRAWIDDLLALEAAGWKGRRGTALAGDPAMADALREMADGLALDGALRMWRLALDGRAIAVMFAVVEQDTAWLGKIAFDETFAAYSPGVLLVLDATASLFAEDGIAHADSCAVAGHPMIDRIWRDRIVVADVIVAGAAFPKFRFSATVAAERAYRQIRGVAAKTYRHLTGSKNS